MSASPRLLALDVFRGVTIAAMILVNNPGTWGAIYAPLEHAKWHGWTPTDLIFPFFLWIVGVAIVFALGGRVERGEPQAAVVRKILRRAATLIAIGIGIGLFPEVFWAPGETFAKLRFPGVLQRIGVCYAVASILFLRCRPRALAWIGAVILCVYWPLLALTPVPGLGAADLAVPAQSIAAWLDRSVFGPSHIWISAKVYDPEGILSTLPAIVTVLFGIAAGRIVRSDLPLEQRIARLMVRGFALASLGVVWDWFFPINKALWTSSYVVFTAGLASCAFGVALWVCDVLGRRRLAEPFRIYGVNAITVFVGSALLGRVLAKTSFGVDTRAFLYRNLCTSWLSGERASLCWALLWVSGWFVVLRVMDRRGWRLRV
ncbi:MAG: heparan-alpha-glucosaminide N-acetyltransferase domain-containing protein [Planctomycetota bacterium]